MTLKNILQSLKKITIKRWVLFIALAICLAGGIYGCMRYFHANKTQLTVRVPEPAGVQVKDQQVFVQKPSSLEIYAQDSDGDNTVPLFRQELFQDSEKLNSLVRMTPQVRGTWRFTPYNNHLIFDPENHWLPNHKYTVTLDKDLFENNVKLATKTLSFITPANDIKIDEFFSIPGTEKKNMSLRGRAHFDYTVEPNTVQNVSLTVNKKTLQPQVQLDASNRVLFIQYDNIPLTDQEQQIELAIKWNKKTVKQFLTLKPLQAFFNLTQVSVLPPAHIGEAYTLAAEFTDLIDAQKMGAADKVKAYLLPYEKGRNWKELPLESVRNNLGKATPVTLKAIPGISAVPSFQITSNLQTRDQKRYIFVEFAPGITSEGDFISKESKSFVLPVPKWPKRLKMIGTGSVLSLHNDHTLQFVAQGINEANITLSRIRRSDINHLVSQSRGDISAPCFGYTYNNYYDDDEEDENEEICSDSSSFNEYDISEVFTKKIPLANTGTKPNFFTLDLNNYLQDNNSGLFIVKVTDKNESITQKRLILISDIGLMYKEEAKGFKVFALSLSSQQPLTDAKVDLLARNGTVIKTRYTNEQGMAEFETATNTTPDKEPVAFIVQQNNDYSFIPVGNANREISYNRFDIGGMDTSWRQNNLEVLLFTDRGIYRPGDTVHFALIAKNKQWSSTAGLPVQIKIDDPRGKTVFDKKVSLTAEGLRDFSFDTETSSATGEYYIRAYHENKEFISDTSFEVKEFSEDNLKVKTRILGATNKGWQPLEGLQAKVDVQNMFGTPAVGNSVKLQLLLQPSSFKFTEYPDYSFSDVIRDKNTLRAETSNLPPLTTSADGEVVQSIDLSSYASGTYALTIRAEAFEQESGKSVKASANTLVSPNPYVIGYKTKADLSYMQQNSRQKIDFIAVDPQLNKVALNDLTLSLFSRQYVSVPVRSGNAFRYQSVLQETLISDTPFQIKKEGTSYPVPTQKPGMYALEIYNAARDKITRLEFMVSGNANISYNLERNAELRLNLEKTTVNPGDTLQFNITAPYTGIGLITLEKDKVYAYKWFKTTTTSSVQTISVPQDLVGSAYLNVSFLRAADSREILLNPHSYAAVPFYVIPEKHISSIDLKTETLVKPGDTLKITYTTPQPTKLVLYGASEGILQVARYKLPNPIAYFFQKQRLGVRSYQMWDLVMADPRILKEVYGIGGDSDAAALAELGLNPFARKTEKPVAFWSGILNASATPRTYTYQVPDYFNGKIRVMAVAVSSQTAASTQQDVLVRAPLVLSAGGPVAVSPDDTFEASVRVSNNYEQTTQDEITVNIDVSDNLQVVGETKKTIHVPYGQEERVSFQVKALDGLGNADINFKATLTQPQTTANRRLTLSVRPASAYRVSIDTGDGKGNFTIKNFVNRNMYKPFSKRQLALSHNPLVAAVGLGAYLEKFPHGCTEQIISQVFPSIVFYKSTGNTAAAQEAFEKTQKRLQMRQQSNGGFSLWDESTNVNPYASLYAFHLLTEADQMGYAVSPDLKNRALEWVTRTASGDDYSAPRYKAYAYYLAARNGVLLTSDLYNLEEYLNKNQPNWQNSITGVYIAAVYKLLKSDEKAERILKAYKPENAYVFYSDYDSSFARNATYLYIVGMHFPQLLQDKKTTQILTGLLSDIQAKRYNTMTSALSILALHAYAQSSTFENDTPEVLANGKPLPLTSQENQVMTADFDSDIKSFEVKSQSTLPLYYVITQQGYDNEPVKASANGLSVSRVYQVPQPEGQLGDEIEVKITAKASKKPVENAVITDVLPGGMTIVPGSLTGTDIIDYYDEREDRLLIYGPLRTGVTTYTYKVKLTATGTFRVPAVTAAALYDTSLTATGAETTFTVKPRD